MYAWKLFVGDSVLHLKILVEHPRLSDNFNVDPKAGVESKRLVALQAIFDIGPEFVDYLVDVLTELESRGVHSIF